MTNQVVIDIGGRPVARRGVAVREMGFGSRVPLPLEQIVVAIDKDDFVERLLPLYAGYVLQVRRNGGESDPYLYYLDLLPRLSLPEFLEHPRAFSDFFAGHVAGETLFALLGADSDDFEWVINDLKEATVSGSRVNLVGEVFRRVIPG